MAINRRLANLLALFGTLAILAAGLVWFGGVAWASLPGCSGRSVYVTFNGDAWYYRPTTNSGSSNTNCLLSTGSAGTGVSTLQESLRRCYNQNIAVDGIYGPQTRQAVINVQNFHHLTPDGVFGPTTSKGMVWPNREFISGDIIGCWP